MPSERERLHAFFVAHPEWAEFMSERAKAGKIMSPEDIRPRDELIIVASHNPQRIDGSVQAQCECGAAIWVSPSTDAMRKAREGLPTRVICVPCFVKDAKEKLIK